MPILLALLRWYWETAVHPLDTRRCIGNGFEESSRARQPRRNGNRCPNRAHAARFVVTERKEYSVFASDNHGARRRSDTAPLAAQ
jgi:hypothetical protein